MEKIDKDTRFTINKPDIIQLFSIATPNGIKVAACLEEIIKIREGKGPIDYEPHSIDIRHGENFDPRFLKISPNGKIPALIDPNGPEDKEISIFESGAILLYLSEKYDALIPKDPILRIETLKWLFWGSSGISSQFKTFGFFYQYCPHKITYCISRYSKECNRLLSVLESQLSHGKNWIIGDEYTIADISIWPWIYGLSENYGEAVKDRFSNFDIYPNTKLWYERCLAREASQRSLEVCPFLFD